MWSGRNCIISTVSLTVNSSGPSITISSPKSTRQCLLVEKPTDFPVFDGPSQTFKLETKDLPALQDGQVLVKVLHLSNDPAQRSWISKDINPDRLYTTPVKLNTPMHAYALCEVVESKSIVSKRVRRSLLHWLDRIRCTRRRGRTARFGTSWWSQYYTLSWGFGCDRLDGLLWPQDRGGSFCFR